MRGDEGGRKKGAQSRAEARAARLEAALKSNLRKRKEQARARQHDPKKQGQAPAGDKAD